MTEQQYRALEIDSYTSIKLFLEDRRKYYKKFILREPVEEEKSEYIDFGSLVDCLQFTPEEVENRFAVSVAQKPTGQYGKFVEQLMKVTIRSINGNGEVTRDLEDMMLDAYNEVKFDRDGNIVDFKRDSFEVVKTKFIGTDLEIHYRQLREAYGKVVVEPSMLERAQAIVQELRTNRITREIMTVVDDRRFQVHNQFPIIGYIDRDITGAETYPAKCLVDKLVIDHVQKIIRIYDLKTAWDNEGEFQSNYFKHKYYIQAALYYYLVIQWKDAQEELSDYDVLYPEFIVADSSNYKSPLVYRTNMNNIDQGMEGFIIRGRYYPGVRKAVTDLVWHKQEGIWNISRDNFETEGIVQIRPFVT